MGAASSAAGPAMASAGGSQFGGALGSMSNFFGGILGNTGGVSSALPQTLSYSGPIASMSARPVPVPAASPFTTSQHGGLLGSMSNFFGGIGAGFTGQPTLMNPAHAGGGARAIGANLGNMFGGMASNDVGMPGLFGGGQVLPFNAENRQMMSDYNTARFQTGLNNTLSQVPPVAAFSPSPQVAVAGIPSRPTTPVNAPAVPSIQSTVGGSFPTASKDYTTMMAGLFNNTAQASLGYGEMGGGYGVPPQQGPTNAQRNAGWGGLAGGIVGTVAGSFLGPVGGMIGGSIGSALGSSIGGLFK